MSTCSRIMILSLFFLASINAHGAALPENFVIEGRLYDTSGLPIATAVDIELEVYAQGAPTCVLYREIHQNVNVDSTTNNNNDGIFAVKLGDGTSKPGDFATVQLSRIFGNSVALNGDSNDDNTISAECTRTIPNLTSAARFVRVSVKINGSASPFDPLTPDTVITSVPSAMVAETLQGRDASNFVQVRDDAATDLNQTNVETIFSAVNFAKLTQMLSGNFAGTTVTNVGTPTAGTDATNKNYVDANIGGKIADVTTVGPATGNGHTLIWDQALNRWVTGTPSATDNTKLPLAGGTMSGAIAMGSQNITNIGHMTMAAQRTLNLGTYDNTQEGVLVGSLGVGDKGKIWFNSQANEFKVWNGTAAISSVGASGAAGGDLSGTYPNPDIATGVVGSAELTDGNVATVDIANDAISSIKINSTGVAVNRLLMTDATTGATVGYKTCALDESLKWTATGWDCTTAAALIGNTGVTAATYGNATQVAQVQLDTQGRAVSAANVSIAFPVTSVAGKTGAVTLNTADISGLGTAAVKSYGTAVGNLVELDGSARIPASLLPTSVGDIQDIFAGSGLTGGALSGSATLSVDTGVTTGKIVQMAASDRLPAVDGSNLTQINAVRLQTRTVSATAPTANQILRWNAVLTNWEPATLAAGGDFLASGSVPMTGNLQLGANYLSGDGGNEGILVSAQGNVQISPTSGAASNLRVNGILTTSTGFNKILDIAATDSTTGTGGYQAIYVNISGTSAASGEKNLIDLRQDATPVFSVNNTGGIYATNAIDTQSYAGTAYASASASTYPQGGLTHLVQNFATINSAHSGMAFTVANASSNFQHAYFNAVSTSGAGNYSPDFVFGRQTGVSTYAESMRITGTGNVGIGTTAPQSLLHVNGIVRATDICDENGANCKDISGGWGVGGDIDGVYTSTGLTGGFATGSGTLSVDVGTTTGKIVQVAASNRLPAMDGSNLTAINAVQLQNYSVSSTAPVATQVLTWNGSTWTPANVPTDPNTVFHNGNSFVSAMTIGTNDNYSLNFETNGSTAVTILPSGNMGVGTVSPGYPLDVNGDIRASSFVATAGGTAGNACATAGLFGFSAGNLTVCNGTTYNVVGTGGTVTSVVAGTGLTSTTITTGGTLNVDVGVGANKIVQMNASSQILGSNVGASNPAYSFSGNTGTGMYSSTTNTLGLSANSISRMFIDSAGDVGVGTTTPTGSFDIYKGVGFNPSLILRDGDVAHGMTALNNTNTLFAVEASHAANGGAVVKGYSDDNTTVGLQLNGYIGNATAPTVPAVVVSAYKKNGTSAQPLGISEFLFGVANNGSIQMRVAGNGEIHAPAICDTFGANCRSTFDAIGDMGNTPITNVTAITGYSGGSFAISAGAGANDLTLNAGSASGVVRIANSMTGPVVLGNATPLVDTRFTVSETATSSATDRILQQNNLGVNIGSPNSSNYTAMIARITPNITASLTGTMTGFKSSVVMPSGGGGTIANITGMESIFGNQSNSSFVTDAYGVVVSPDFSGTGGITNAYGVYIKSAIGSNATNQYGIYQQSPNVANYFGGTLGIGATPQGTQDLVISKTGQQVAAVLEATDASAVGHNAEINIHSYEVETSLVPSIFTLNTTRGAKGATTAIQSNDILGRIGFGGSGGSSTFAQAAAIETMATSTYSTSSFPGRMNFLTTNVGQTTPAVRMSIDPNGWIGVGTGSMAPFDQHIVYSSANAGVSMGVATSGTLTAQTANLNLYSLADGNSIGASAGNKGWQFKTYGNAHATVATRNDLALSYYDGAVWKTPLAIDSITGSLGVGNTAPTYPLDVLSSGAKTVADTGAFISNASTSTTPSIIKRGLAVHSNGTWSGASATNIGLEVNVLGGTTNYAATFMGGNVGVGTTTPSAGLDVAGTTKLGSTGVAFASMGGCTLTSFAAAGGANARTCTGVPAGAAVYCSPTTSQGATVTWGAWASAANTVTINMSAAGVTSIWKCMWMVP